MLVDEATVNVKGGKGGDGCSSFYHTSHRKKIPSGGDGGKGGDIYFVADKNLYSLFDFQHKKNLKAFDGKRGSSANKTGKSGKDVFIKVPCGTIAKDKDTGNILADLKKEGQSVIVCHGGQGGKGNNNFPFAQKGEVPQERTIFLELKYICDVGLVGFPNAGKSTLINALSPVHSRVGMYPFTTKRPFLGVMSVKGERIVFSDIPGIIEHAHQGKGLGITFLKHVERSKVLLFVIDPSMLQELSPKEQFEILRDELRQYKPELLKRKYLIALNKSDLKEAQGAIKKFLKYRKRGVCLISALEEKGLDNLLDKAYKIVKKTREDEADSN